VGIDRKAQALANLLEIKEILDGLGMVWWLDGGTLLGAYRDKDFCEDDEDDIDLCTWGTNLDKLDEIEKRAIEMGFEVIHRWDERAAQLAVSKTDLKIDLFFNEVKGDNAWALLRGSGDPIPVVIPLHFYQELKTINFLGTKFLIPKDTEDYLSLKYGEWEKKVHRYEYSCYENDDNKVVRRDFEWR